MRTSQRPGMRGSVAVLATVVATAGFALVAPAATADVIGDPTDIAVGETYGVLPAPMTAAALTSDPAPDPVAIAHKELLDANYAADVTQLLALGATSAAPTSSEVAASFNTVMTPCATSSDCGPTPPASFELPLTTQAQIKPWYCVPASAAIVLTSVHYGDPGQAKLAAEMHTVETGDVKTRGTAYANVPYQINRRYSGNYYYYKTDTADPQALLRNTVTDTWGTKSPFFMAINVAMTRYYPSGYTGNHSVVPYGYWTAGGGGIRVFDPERGTDFGQPRSFYGPHPLSTADAWRAFESEGKQLVW